MNLKPSALWRPATRRKLSWSGDAVAGVSAWALLVPEALAIALIAGVSPIAGLYALPPALLLYAAIGPSRFLIVGPVSTTALLSAVVIASQGTVSAGEYAALTAALAILTGVLGLAVAGLKLGFVASFVPVAAVKGLTIGLALTVVVTQAPLLLGVSRESNVFLDQAWALVEAMDDVNGWTFILGAGALTLLFELRNRLPRLPAGLIVLALGTLIVRVAGLEEHGVAIVGPLDSGLPSPAWPDGVDAASLRDLAPGAAAVLLLGVIETLSAARAAGQKRPEGEDTDREIAAVAAANIGAGVFGGLVVNGNVARTRANAASGARTKLAMAVAAALVAGVLLVTGVLEYTPLAVLAAVAIAIVAGLIDLRYLEQLYGLARAEAGAAGLSGARTLHDLVGALCVIVAVLLLGVLPGFIIAVVTAIVLLMINVARPRVSIETGLGFEQHTEALSVVILRPETSLFFANTGHVRAAIERFAEDNEARTVVLDIEGTQRLDATGAEMVVDLAAFLEEREQQLLVVRSLSPARRLLIATADSRGAHLDVFGSVDAAVASVTAPPRVDERRLRRRPA